MNERLKAFFDLTDRYLIADLRTMSSINKSSGGLGYPMLQTILSGMELVGKLISGHKNRGAFDSFWGEFKKDHPEYDGLDELFRSLRNSTAHIFHARVGIQVSKSRKGHLTRTKEGCINIDALDLFNDFEETYKRVKQSVLAGTMTHKYAAVEAELLKDHELIAQAVSKLQEWPESPRPWDQITPSGTNFGGVPSTTYQVTTSGGSATILPMGPIEDR